VTVLTFARHLAPPVVRRCREIKPQRRFAAGAL
jgi:hypothetical protein